MKLLSLVHVCCHWCTELLAMEHGVSGRCPWRTQSAASPSAYINGDLCCMDSGRRLWQQAHARVFLKQPRGCVEQEL